MKKCRASVKATLAKIKVVRDIDSPSFVLKMEVENQVEETTKFTGKEIEVNKVFRKFIEVGRVVLVNYGPSAGKLAVVVEIINTAKVLIDGPTTGVSRQEISMRRLSLTEFKVEVPRGVKRAALKKAITDFGLEKQWGQTSWARKLQKRARRAALTDFDRFKVKLLKQRRTVLQNTALKAKK